MKEEGDRERAIINKLNAEVQARKRAQADEATNNAATTTPP
jgi:hypothetical protein